MTNYTQGFGGSEIAVIMGTSPYKTRHRLWLEKRGKIETLPVEGPHIERGHMAEIVARDKFERETGVKFTQTSWPCEDGLTRCTDDGYNAEVNQFLEIKAMGKDNHAAAKIKIIPPHYIAQVQWNLMRIKAAYCWFISVRPEEDYELAPIQVTHDLAYQEEMLEAAREFKRLIETDTPPELVEGDYVNLGGESEFAALADEYKKELALQKDMESRIETIKSRLLEIMGKAPGIKCNGLTVTQYTRKGNVEYKKIPELQGVDLEAYRGKSVVAHHFTVAK